MWVCTLSVPYKEENLLARLAKKHAVAILGYPLSHERKGGKSIITASGIFLGDDKNVAALTRELRRDQKTARLELKQNYGIIQFKQHEANAILFQPGVLFRKPIFVDHDGTYWLELGAWDKKKLSRIIEAYTSPWFQGKLHSIKQQQVTRVQVFTPFPELSAQQQKCLSIAIENKYYDYPRKSDLKTLAKLAGISYATFQYHLRVAEKKVMPFLTF